MWPLAEAEPCPAAGTRPSNRYTLYINTLVWYGNHTYGMVSYVMELFGKLW